MQELDAAHVAEAEALTTTLRRTIAREHDVPVHAVMLVRAGSLPRTTSGKIRRQACRAAFLDGTLAVVGGGRPAPQTGPPIRATRFAAIGEARPDGATIRPPEDGIPFGRSHPA